MVDFLSLVKTIFADFNRPAPHSNPLEPRGLDAWLDARALTVEEAEALRGVWMGAQVGDLILPTYSPTGEVIGARLWAQEGKRLAPRADSGLATTGAILANAAGRAILEWGSGYSAIIFAEGEPDFVTACLLAQEVNAKHGVGIAVFGIYSGAWVPAFGERIGAVCPDASVFIATDRDTAGERYAGQIRASLPLLKVYRSQLLPGKDLNDLWHDGALRPTSTEALNGQAMPQPPSAEEGRWAWSDAAAGWSELPSWAAAREAEKAWAAARAIPREALDDVLLERAKKWCEAKLEAVCAELAQLDGNRARALAIMAPVMSLVAGGALDLVTVSGELSAAYVSGDKDTRKDRAQQIKDALKSGPGGRPRDPVSLEDVAARLAADDAEERRRAEAIEAERKAARATERETRKKTATVEREGVKIEAGEVGAGEGMGEPDGAWADQIVRKKGKVCNHVGNWLLILDNDRRLGEVRFNMLGQAVEVWGSPTWARGLPDGAPLKDHLLTELSAEIGRVYGTCPTKALLMDAVGAAAHRRAYDPVLKYLDGLKWDGVKRIDSWLIDYCKTTADAESARLTGAWWLMGAVARVIKPGCQADYSIILEGAQGERKSSAVLALCPNPDWFLAFDHDPATKEALEALQGKWLVELAELAVLSRGRDMRQIKSFITRRSDKYRTAYATISEDRPRRCVFFGTVNPEGAGDYLSDPTGNRRWWPALVTSRVDVAGIERDRDQLWAEAVARVRAGERHYPEEQWEFEILNAALSLRTSDNKWIIPIRAWLEREAVDELGKPLERVSSYQILISCLGFATERIKKVDEMDVGIALRALGWTPAKDRRGDRVWVRPRKAEAVRVEDPAPKQLVLK